VIEVWQAEWCPHSALVRQRLTELDVSYVARQVPARPEERDELRAATGQDAIPAVVLDDGTVLAGADEAILAGLDERFDDPPGAADHRAQADAHASPAP
jgi:glutaredoxin